MRNKSVLFVLLIYLISIGCKKDPLNEIVTDINGNNYHTIIIGTQTWMVENLKATKYNDGTDIPNISADSEWNSYTEGAYCNYQNKESNADEYGRLYNWYAIKTGKLAPKGWRVATDNDWTILANYLGGIDVAGEKIKESGNTHWFSPKLVASNSSGFTAIPAGMRYFDGFYTGMYDGAIWWTSTAKDENSAWFRSVGPEITSIRRDLYPFNNGFSVRCVKD